MVYAGRKERHLLPGENPRVDDVDAARRWLTIYQQRQALLALDRESTDHQAASIADGVAYWKERVAKLSGFDLDPDRRTVRFESGGEVLLTSRELQLLEFLAQHQGRHFPDHVLAVRAWGERLSGDQVRIYVRRLRRKLEGSGWELISKRGYGYTLERAGRVWAHRANPGRLSSDAIAGMVGRAHALLAAQRRQLERSMTATEALRRYLDGEPGRS